METVLSGIAQYFHIIWQALRDNPNIFQFAALVSVVSAMVSTLLYIWFVIWWRRHPDAIKINNSILAEAAVTFRLLGVAAWPFVFMVIFCSSFFASLLEALNGHVDPKHGLTNHEIIKYLVEKEWLTIPAIFVAIILYRLRGTRRFLYGIFEVIVGLVAIWCGLHVNGPTVQLDTILPNTAESGLLFTKVLSIATGIYIIIRGLDNMAQKLPRWMHVMWDMFFPNGRKIEAAIAVKPERSDEAAIT